MEAEAQRERAEYGAVVANIKLVQVRLAEKSTAAARELLAKVPDRFRDWEWGYLLNESWRTLRTRPDLGLREPRTGLSTAEGCIIKYIHASTPLSMTTAYRRTVRSSLS